MLWFKKQPDVAAIATGGIAEVISAAPLAVEFDPPLFQHKLSALQHNVEDSGGVEAFVTALRAKHEFYDRVLSQDALPGMTESLLEELLDTVFSARRRIYSELLALGMPKVSESIYALLYGPGELSVRMEAFSHLIPLDENAGREVRKQAGKNRRAAFDFGAEMLHFRDPERYPLMTRWVWDQSTVSGALREFVRGGDARAEIPLGTSPEMFEGARAWLVTQLAEQGVYRDMPYWVDLVLVQAYTEYFRSMADGMLSADFGRGITPVEHLRKFLGIDAPLREGVTRVKRVITI